MRSKLCQRAWICACVFVVAVAIAACGSSSSSSTSSGGSTPTASATSTASSGSSGTSTSAASSGGSSLAAVVAADQKAPQSIAITTPLKTKPPTGKTIAFLECSQPVCQGFLQGLTPAAKALGWNLKSLTFQPTPEAEIAALDQAITDKVDGIFVTGLASSVIKSSLDKAAAAHIPVIGGYDANPVVPPLIADVATPAGNSFGPTAVANYIANDSHCSGDAEVFSIKIYPILVYTSGVLEKKLKELCPNMSVKEYDVQATDVGTKIPSEVNSVLQSNPKIKYLAFAFGDMALGVPAALNSAGQSAQVIGFGAGEPTNVENVAKGVETVETAYGIPYAGWRAMDALARHFEGMSPAVDTTAPNAGELFTKSNAGQVNSWLNTAMPADNQQQWEKLWHIG